MARLKSNCGACKQAAVHVNTLFHTQLLDSNHIFDKTGKQQNINSIAAMTACTSEAFCRMVLTVWAWNPPRGETKYLDSSNLELVRLLRTLTHRILAQYRDCSGVSFTLLRPTATIAAGKQKRWKRRLFYSVTVNPLPLFFGGWAN